MNSLKSDLSSLKEEVASGEIHYADYVFEADSDTYWHVFTLNGKGTNNRLLFYRLADGFTVPKNAMLISVIPIGHVKRTYADGEGSYSDFANVSYEVALFEPGMYGGKDLSLFVSKSAYDAGVYHENVRVWYMVP